MKHLKAGLAGMLACVFLVGCKGTTNSTEDEEMTQNTGVPNVITHDVAYMKIFNCLNLQAAVFWKRASQADHESQRYVFAPSGISPIYCPGPNQTSWTISFDPGVAYDIKIVRIDNNCQADGEDPIQVEPDDCDTVHLFRVNGTDNDETTEVRID